MNRLVLAGDRTPSTKYFYRTVITRMETWDRSHQRQGSRKGRAGCGVDLVPQQRPCAQHADSGGAGASRPPAPWAPGPQAGGAGRGIFPAPPDLDGRPGANAWAAAGPAYPGKERWRSRRSRGPTAGSGPHTCFAGLAALPEGDTGRQLQGAWCQVSAEFPKGRSLLFQTRGCAPRVP